MRFKAELKLRTAESGGKPIASRLRAACWLGATSPSGSRAYNDAELVWDEPERISPGDTVLVELNPLVSDYWAAIGIGSTIEVCEGPSVIGDLVVRDIIPDQSDYA